MAKNGNLSIEDSMDLLILLLFSPGKRGESEPIEGITRLQKLMFLLQQGKGPKELVRLAKEYEYEPYKMGPYSSQLGKDIEELKSAGLLGTERLEYLLPDDGAESERGSATDDVMDRGLKKVASLRFRLTRFGQEVADDLWKTMDHAQQAELKEFKRFFNSISLRQLLIFVYEKYPKYTSNSTIKNQLGM